MKKKILIIFFGSALVIAGALIYLNNVILPLKIKSSIIRWLEEQTHKTVSLESVQFSLFKGLVLRDLSLSDDTGNIASIKEASCTFLFWPFFKKALIIPTVAIKSPVVTLERRADKTLSLADLFIPKAQSGAKSNFKVFIYKISIIGGQLNFKDNSLAPAFSKAFENLNLNLYLSLPASIKFNLSSEINAAPKIKISAEGNFRIPQKQLFSRIKIKGLLFKEFQPYYPSLGISNPANSADLLVKINFKDNIVTADLEAGSDNFIFSKNTVSANLNPVINAHLEYSLDNRQWKYNGKANFSESSVSGLGIVDRLQDINAAINFDNLGLSSDKLTATAFGIPCRAQMNIRDFNNPLLELNVASSMNLAALKQVLSDKLKFDFPGDIKGEGDLSVKIQHSFLKPGPPAIEGFLSLKDGIAAIAKIKSPLESINGRIQFTNNGLEWSQVNFKYQDTLYTTGGSLINFSSPQVKLALSSNELSLESDFLVNNRLITLSQLSAKFLNSDFFLQGKADTTNPARLQLDTVGKLNIDLSDAGQFLKKFKINLEAVKPAGKVQVDFNLNGNINDFKSCFVEAKFLGPALSVYGLRSGPLTMVYNQADGIADIPLFNLGLYGGMVQAAAKLNLNSPNSPFWLNLDIQGLDIAQLKQDTPAKDKDIAGIIQAQAKINGFANDLSRLNGSGSILVSQGRLWQLNLFKGMGELIFVSAFTNVVFDRAACDFIIQDKQVYTDNLKLESNIANLNGNCRIGFNGSLDAAIDVKILDENVPLTNTFKDITTAILGQADKLGTIKISGTLSEPKYSFKPAVTQIINTIKDSILKMIFKK